MTTIRYAQTARYTLCGTRALCASAGEALAALPSYIEWLTEAATAEYGDDDLGQCELATIEILENMPILCTTSDGAGFTSHHVWTLERWAPYEH